MDNDAQIEYWNGAVGQKWADQADWLDEMLAQFADKVLETANIQQNERTLDIGCGAGALTIKAAIAGGNAEALGIDVSAPLVKLARKRATDQGSAATFRQTDASLFVADLPFDCIISRFGVMFFEDPIAAFANIRQQCRGGRLAFICWQAFALNDWVFVPLQAALPLLKEPPEQTDPTMPGPFAFADKDRVAVLMNEAGWKTVSVDPFFTNITLPGTDIATSARFMLEFGPLSRLIADQDLQPEPIQQALINRLHAEAQIDGRIAMRAACWIVTAHTD